MFCGVAVKAKKSFEDLCSWMHHCRLEFYLTNQVSTSVLGINNPLNFLDKPYKISFALVRSVYIKCRV